MLLLLLLTCFISNISSNENVIVDLAQGKIQGSHVRTFNNKSSFYSFKGIPYAKPLVGVNKFQSPELSEPWDGVLDATQHRSKCAHWAFMRRTVVGGDDCLHLNVYTPKLPSNGGAKIPVLVLIHFGFLKEGSGDGDIIGPDNMIMQGVIFVTLNHRLGATGFLSTNDANSPGNNGFKDQVVALRWIQANIHSFGGDPKSVTIMSECAIHHLLSPMSKGLFSKVVVISGGLLQAWTLTREPRELAMRFGRKLGIETNDTSELMDKLKGIDVKELALASEELRSEENILSGSLNYFTPSVEPDIGQEIFITDDLLHLLKYGDIADVPVMMGTSRDDGSYLVPGIMHERRFPKDRFDKFIPNFLNKTDATVLRKIGDSIKKFYFDDKPDLYVDDCLDRIMTDVGFFAGSAITAKILASRLSSPVYEYLFTFDSYMKVFNKLFNIDRGVMYLDIYFYFLHNPTFKYVPEPESAEEVVLHRFTKMLANFAKEGNPTAKQDKDVKVEWLPVNDGKNCMDIGSELTMRDHVNKDRLAFWAELYKDILGEYKKIFS